ncbi:MAG: transposase [Heteroscytonema crispum UTEX LB 1556]
MKYKLCIPFGFKHATFKKRALDKVFQMSRVFSIEITESQEDLKRLLAQQKTASGKERLQALYLLKSKQVDTVQHLSVILGRDHVTVQRWLRQYRNGGLEAMLKRGIPTGRPKIIPDWVVEQLKLELSEQEGFSRYGEVQTKVASRN